MLVYYENKTKKEREANKQTNKQTNKQKNIKKRKERKRLILYIPCNSNTHPPDDTDVFFHF